MVPVFLATRGNVHGALGAPIASGLHQGLTEPRLRRDERVVDAAVASLIPAIGISILVGVITWAALLVLPGWTPASLVVLVVTVSVSGALTSVVMTVGLLALIFAGFGRATTPTA